jgi:branched-chain amino acid transport system substrate-binding protein
MFAATDYSIQCPGRPDGLVRHRWPKHADYGKRNPRLACSYMFASPYASAPIKAVKDQATMLGFDIGPDQDVSLFAVDTKSQALAMKDFKPDVVWHGNTTMSVSATVRDARALGLGADHIVNNWGLDENLPRLGGAAAEGVMGAAVCAFYGEDVPMMDKWWNTPRSSTPACPRSGA